MRTVRSRILAAVLALTALALALAGGTAYALQRDHIDRQIDEALTSSADEFRTLAESGVDPLTGHAFSTAEDLVITAIQLTVPSGNEGIVGLRSGQRPLVSSQDVSLRLQDDPDFINAVSMHLGDSEMSLLSLTTATTSYRVMVAPVTATDQAAQQRATGLGATGAAASGTQSSNAALVIAIDRNAELRAFDDIARTFLLLALGALVLTGIVGWVVAGRLLKPIHALSATARRVSQSDLSQRLQATGDDDLSELTRTFNAMLDRLESAFSSQQALLNDVGHELRTPLTVVRGHLELMDVSDAADAESTREIALDELDRMHRLVDDLTTLASVEAPEFVRTAPVEVGLLTDDVLDKARALGDRRWRVSERAEALAELDAQRVTQAWLQLCANAVKFSARGSTISLGSRIEPDTEHVVLSVRDHGIGIAAESLPTIFERFVRVDNGPRRREGAGLGLAIVAAIAHGHGGVATVASTEGEGSTFQLVLPRHGPATVADGERSRTGVHPDRPSEPEEES